MDTTRTTTTTTRRKCAVPFIVTALLLAYGTTPASGFVPMKSTFNGGASYATLQSKSGHFLRPIGILSLQLHEQDEFERNRNAADHDNNSNVGIFLPKQENVFSAINKWQSSISKAVAAALLSAVLILSCTTDASNALESNLPAGKRYWSIMEDPTSTVEQRVVANEALFDYVIGTVNTMYYDNSGGAYFAPREFYTRWREYRAVASHKEALADALKTSKVLSQDNLPETLDMETRQGSVEGLKWLISSLGDPYSTYLTRDELRNELSQDANGFLGLGAIVQAPKQQQQQKQYQQLAAIAEPKLSNLKDKKASIANARGGSNSNNNARELLTPTRIANLPIVTAVAPDSPAERSGLVVGDRIVAVGDHNFLGFTRKEVAKTLAEKYSAENYFGYAEMTVAKPVTSMQSRIPYGGYGNDDGDAAVIPVASYSQEVVLGYRQTRVRLPTKAVSPYTPYASKAVVSGGDAMVHYELLTSASGSIFDKSKIYSTGDDATTSSPATFMTNPDAAVNDKSDTNRVGYIRLTRFSKASTAAFIKAIETLDDAGAQAYIFDLRNNYGGVIQEAMLTASALLRDSHSILCYTLNSRGGFTPHDVEEFVVDKRYPGYLLSTESKTATLDQVQRESPAMFMENGIAWTPPSAFASLHEQTSKRGIRSRVSDLYYTASDASFGADNNVDDALNIRRLRNQLDPAFLSQLRAQKNIVILVNEGTASAAEVFASSLHDNGRLVALVGSQTYGKGLIQHTFPLPDGGGLRLTVAEYLTPSLRHVTKVGSAQFDQQTGNFVGGGIRPDIICESKQGIPSNIGADLCVGVALDALEEADDDLKYLDATIEAQGSSQLVASNTSPLFSRWMTSLKR